jgi:hypothetical protein
MSTRLFVLLAREAEVGVVFRRGPSKQVLLLCWDLKRDSFEAGQWLKARVYERRCDLSPGGERLVYFAANYRGPYQTWTAVSRPPYFTALALWPKGDAWGGGGLFASDKELLLNHPESQRGLAAGFSTPKGLRLGALPNAGRGEDSPIFDERLRRDGWEFVQSGIWVEQKRDRLWIRVDPPEVWSKPHPVRSTGCRLRMQIEGLQEKDGTWYLISYQVEGAGGGNRLDLGRADWADWSSRGDLLFARDGKLFRVPMKSRKAFDPETPARQLVDLSSLKFEAREAPPEAKSWSGKTPVGRLIKSG